MDTFSSLRQKHPSCSYDSFAYTVHDTSLIISWQFSIEPDLIFRPTVHIPLPENYSLESIDAFVFTLGMVELLSYWKATCSPTINIKAGKLNAEQLVFWRNLLIQGMGEYFYQNDIDFTRDDLVQFQVDSDTDFAPQSVFHNENLNPKNLILVGGGKDSVVALETIKASKESAQVLLVNPTSAALEVSRIAGYEHPIVVTRIIDPQLLELNAKGYLNGHTPFSALLALLAALVAHLHGFNQLVVGNERSSDEGNVLWKEQEINHQYSKSFAFETQVGAYIKQYLSGSIAYFSLLRPLYELQIARVFSQFPQYFDAFLSCNRLKTSWCKNCPKCLFTFSAQAPFIGLDRTIHIFGGDVFRNLDLIPLVDASLNETQAKPFECVGTREETRLAFERCSKLYTENLPPVLAYVKKHYPPDQNSQARQEDVMQSWGNDTLVPPALLNQLHLIAKL